MRSRYDYTVVNGGVNHIGQRMGVRTTFDLGGGHATNPGDTSWGYDSLGQVNSAAAPGTAADRAYQFDAIGNRIEARDGVTVVSGIANYAANALNQYTLAKGVTLPTTPAPYDLDGNLRFDGGVNNGNQPRECRWDAENRLIEVRDGNGTPLVAYTYDAQSRRISSTQSPISNPQSTLYLYDAWNCIAEWSADLQSASLTRTCTWGMDLSGSMQGTGGVGGLLSETINNQPSTINFFPTYDGNGNISEYLAADGSTAAHFEYDPFGNTVVNTDTSNQFAYRFSTKPLDHTTGLYYYGYRWYDPLTGRWPSRDPIEERGGVNLYGFVRNDGVNTFDYLGLESEDSDPCADCNNAIEKAKEDAGYKALVSGLEKKHCPIPSITCKCLKNSNTRGEYLSGKITLNCTPNQADYIVTIVHEMVHAFDDCYGRLPPPDASVTELCSKKACTEIRAYCYSNCRNIQDPDEKRNCVRNGAIGSVGNTPSCMDAEKWVDQMLDSCMCK